MTTILFKIGQLPTHCVPAMLEPPALKRPLAVCTVPAGFASPARDYKSKSLDLNDLLIRNSPATFFWNVSGDSMRDEGINNGDLLIIDRSLEAKHGDVVIAEINGDVAVKKLYKRAKVVELRSANPAYEPIRFEEGDELLIWGVVRSVVHIFKA